MPIPASVHPHSSEQGANYLFQRIFQNKPLYGKDRQRYPLDLTAF